MGSMEAHRPGTGQCGHLRRKAACPCRHGYFLRGSGCALLALSRLGSSPPSTWRLVHLGCLSGTTSCASRWCDSSAGGHSTGSFWQ